MHAKYSNMRRRLQQKNIQEQIENLQEQVNQLEMKIYKRSCCVSPCKRAGTVKIRTLDGYKIRVCREHALTFLGCSVLGRFGKKLRIIEG